MLRLTQLNIPLLSSAGTKLGGQFIDGTKSACCKATSFLWSANDVREFADEMVAGVCVVYRSADSVNALYGAQDHRRHAASGALMQLRQ